MALEWRYLTPIQKFLRVVEALFHDALLFPYVALLFYFIGGFSLRETAAVVILYGLIWSWHKQNQGSVQAIQDCTSSPYEVHIQPNLPKMLRDLSLVPPEWEGHSYEVTAVVLRSNLGLDPLIHWAGPNRYTRNLEYKQKLDFVELPRLKDECPALEATKKFLDGTDWSPVFFFKHGSTPNLPGYGYIIGISVHGDWWKSNKDRLIATGIVKGAEESGGWTDITLALLPLRAFNLIDWKWITDKRRQEIRDEIIRDFPPAGWTAAPYWGSLSEKIDTSGEAIYCSNYARIGVWLVK